MTYEVKRYFYTDPLAASWMAKHFGMKLLAESDFDGLVDAGARFIDCDDTFRELWQHDFIYLGKLYVHPDSLGLLEPKKGDLIHIVRGFCSYHKNVDDVAKGGGKTVTGIWSDGEHWDITTKKPLHDWEIIQCAGKAFHWPESESL